MLQLYRYSRAVVFMGAILLGSGHVLADTSASAKKAPAAAEFYPLVGKWHGGGEMAQPGQAPIKLSLNLDCSKVSSGWGIRCSMHAKNKEMSMSESDLMGVDPVTGQAHWYAVSDQGETHDHLARWVDPRTMLAHYSWIQGGKSMRETISFKLETKRKLSFRSSVSMDGKDAGSFSGVMKR